MEVKINREIRDYTEAVFFGMSLRQCAFAVLACGAAVGLYFLLSPYFGLETLSWVCILGAAPFVAIGFIRYHSMTAEQFVWTWIKSEILMPQHLSYSPSNSYRRLLEAAEKDNGTLRRRLRGAVAGYAQDA